LNEEKLAHRKDEKTREKIEKYSLKCVSCGKEYDQKVKLYKCKCGGKLDVRMNIDKIEINLAELEKRNKMRNLHLKYFEFLPLLDSSDIITIGEGFTPLVKARRLGEFLGVPNLYLKNETVSATGSFKDRPIGVGANKAKEFGVNTVASASSGNAANSLAAYSAKLGLNCVTFVPATAPSSKISQLLMYGAKVVPISRPENYLGDPTVVMLKEACEKFGWYPVPSFGTLNPYQIEGAKTIGYEIAESFAPNVPEYIIIPVGGAGLLLGNYKSFKEFHKLGLVQRMPRLVAIQADGCAPFVKAWKEKRPIETWQNPSTIAGGLADPYTWDGDMALEALRDTEGCAESIDDKSIFEAAKLLARYEGIFAEPTGSAALAGFIKMLKEETIPKRDWKEVIVVEVTGAGFKDLGIVAKEFGMPSSVPPSLNEVKGFLSKEYKFEV